MELLPQSLDEFLSRTIFWGALMMSLLILKWNIVRRAFHVNYKSVFHISKEFKAPASEKLLLNKVPVQRFFCRGFFKNRNLMLFNIELSNLTIWKSVYNGYQDWRLTFFWKICAIAYRKDNLINQNKLPSYSNCLCFS